MIQNEKEVILKELGIDRGAAHGGDPEGRKCTDFVQKADEFFDRCLKIDEKAVREGTAQASLNEVQLMNEKNKQLAILTDGMFHYVNMGYEDAIQYNGNLFSDVKTHLKAFIWLWGYLRLFFVGAKIHLVKDHRVQQMKRWKGIGSFNEEFIEADHVTGNREVRAYASLRSDIRKAQAISKNEAMRSNPKVQRIKNEISPKRKRKRLSVGQKERLIERRVQVLEEIQHFMLMFPVSEISTVQIKNY